MDIFSHGIWTNIVARTYNLEKPKTIRPLWAAFWGMIPDLISFIPVTLWFGFSLLSGQMDFHDLPGPEEMEPVTRNHYVVYATTRQLYQISHSAVIFAAIFALVFVYRKFCKKRIPWEMLGWLLHICIDVPTHTYAVFPTPVFWPFSNWRFDGIQWSTPWFMMVNVTAMVMALVWIRDAEHKRK